MYPVNIEGLHYNQTEVKLDGREKMAHSSEDEKTVKS